MGTTNARSDRGADDAAAAAVSGHVLGPLRIGMAGAGLPCTVIARLLAEAGHRIQLFDRRAHVAGNCHTERDAGSGVMVPVYGPHTRSRCDKRQSSVPSGHRSPGTPARYPHSA